MRINIYSNKFIYSQTYEFRVCSPSRGQRWSAVCIYKDTSCSFQIPCRKFITPGITMHYFTHPLALVYSSGTPNQEHAPPTPRPGITSAVIRQCYKNVKTPPPRLKEKSDLLSFSFESFNSFFFSIHFSSPLRLKKRKFVLKIVICILKSELISLLIKFRTKARKPSNGGGFKGFLI